MRAEFDETSILGRYGPDEFLVVAPPDHSADLVTRDRPAARPDRRAQPPVRGLRAAAGHGQCRNLLRARRRRCRDRAAGGGRGRPRRGQGQRRQRGPGRRCRAQRPRPGRTLELRRPGRPGPGRRYQGSLHQAPLRGCRPLRTVPGRPHGPRRRAAPDDRDRRPAPRRGQDRDPRRDPAQAGSADRGRVRNRQAARRPGRLDRPDRAQRGPRPGRRTPPPRALGRAAATSTGCRARRSP